MPARTCVAGRLRAARAGCHENDHGAARVALHFRRDERVTVEPYRSCDGLAPTFSEPGPAEGPTCRGTQWTGQPVSFAPPTTLSSTLSFEALTSRRPRAFSPVR